MLFISYCELNENFDLSEMAEVGLTLINKKLYPVEGVKEIGWYISTGDHWGITVEEADSEEQIGISNNVWRIAKPGIFKIIKTPPALKGTKSIQIGLKLAK